MRYIVDTYQKERQIFLNSEKETPIDEALSSVGEDLQRAFVLQHRRLMKHSLKLVFREEFLSGSKQEGEYFKEWIEDKRKYIFQNGSNSKKYRIVQKVYCIKYDSEGKNRVAFVESKVLSIKSYIKRLKNFWRYYFGDIEYIKDTLLNPKFVFVGMILVWALIFLCIGLSYLLNDDRVVDIMLDWPILCMLAILAVVFIIRNKEGIEKKTSDMAILCIQQRKPDFLPEKFKAMATARLKCIYYAESQEEIGDFLSTDINDFLDQHEDVVNCEQTGFLFENFWVYEDYMYMDVEQKVLLDLRKLNRIEQQEETVIVRFTKPINSIMSEDFYQDWYVTGVEVVKEPEYE